MLRPLLLKAANIAKADGISDTLIRYNPLLRKRVIKKLAGYGQHGNMALLNDIIRAATHTPYGKSRLLSLEAWPVLEKEQIRAQPKHCINPYILPRLPCATGGTTGVPLKLARSLESVVAEQYFLDRLLAPYGLSMRSKVAVLRSDNIKAPRSPDPPYGKISHAGKRYTFSAIHLCAETLGWFMSALQSFKPDILWVYPSAAANLLALIEASGQTFHVPVILSSSENMSAELHKALEEKFGAKVINYYGQAERACFAYSTRPEEFFFEPRYGQVEFGESIAHTAEEVMLPIIGTSYWNKAMPLMRYHTGDRIFAPAHYGQKELAEIAAGIRPFSSIAGRDSEYLLTRDGMRIVGLNQIPRELNHVLQIQLVQEDYDNIVVYVITLPGFSQKDRWEIESRAKSKIPASMNITIREAAQLYTTPRGKTPFVVRRFEERR